MLDWLAEGGYIYMYIRAVTILDFSNDVYCGHKNSRYRYIAISIETLGGGGRFSFFQCPIFIFHKMYFMSNKFDIYICQIMFYFVY